MADIENSDELTRLREWWAANGTGAVIGIVVGLLVIGGWYAWGWYDNRQDAQAADIYGQIQQGIGTGNVTSGVVGAVKKLEDNYSGTPYAAAAAMSLAAYYVNQTHYHKAAAQLDWAINNAAGGGMRQIARVRKARVLWARGKPKAALALLDAKHPPAFDALYEELIGDIQAARGDRRAAYSAYKKALASLPANASPQPLRQKMAENAPSDNADGPPSAQKSSS